MKRLTALLILFALLLNGGGYLLIFQFLIYLSDVKAENRINRDDYKKVELTVIKVLVRMNAVVDWPDYEQIQGHILYNGHNYNYVGLKVTRDTMFMLCLQNREKNQLLSERATLEKEASDSFHGKKTQALFKTALKLVQYCSERMQIKFSDNMPVLDKINTSLHLSNEDPFISTRGRPPAIIA